MTLAICDDSDREREEIKSLALDWSARSGAGAEVLTYPTAEALLFECEDRMPDILLLDIEMPGKSGVELAKELRARGCRAEIVFITSHFEFCGEGYEVDALHYLMKPVSREKLFEVLGKAASRLAVEPPSVVVHSEGETVRIFERDIYYIEASLHYLTLHTTRGEVRVKEPLAELALRLSPDFYRAHRSFIVSLRHIVRISRTSLTLATGAVIPLSRGRYDDINREFIKRVH